jgi:hypothetical protein
MPNMDKPERAPNIVPRGAIRLSEAFETLCCRLEPLWQDLQQRCVQWDEQPDIDINERREDPYPQLFAATYRAENIFRWALRDGELRAYVHNLLTGVDLELDTREWSKFGEQVGIGVDYTGPQLPGPDCTLNGMRQPIFLLREDFDQWVARKVDAGASTLDEAPDRSVREETGRVLATRAFSVEEVMKRTGLSKTKFYVETGLGNLRARKCGSRTLILETDLDKFLNRLEDATFSEAGGES